MKRRRLIIHPGMPKTGTSAIQRFLWDNRDTLNQVGWTYPNIIRTGDDPRHQFLYVCLQKQHYRTLVRCVNETTGDIILSTEAICTHLRKIPLNPNAFRDATAGLDVEVIVTHREPTAWLRSLYLQVQKNGNTVESFDKFCANEGIKFCCDRNAVDRRLATLFGARVTRMEYNPDDAVRPILDHLGIADADWPAARRVNETAAA